MCLLLSPVELALIQHNGLCAHYMRCSLRALFYIIFDRFLAIAFLSPEELWYANFFNYVCSSLFSPLSCLSDSSLLEASWCFDSCSPTFSPASAGTVPDLYPVSLGDPCSASLPAALPACYKSGVKNRERKKMKEFHVRGYKSKEKETQREKLTDSKSLCVACSFTTTALIGDLGSSGWSRRIRTSQFHISSW